MHLTDFFKSTWFSALINSFYCLIGCAIGDLGTILYFQLNSIEWHTIILLKKMNLVFAFKTALGMSVISMLIMELAMNIVDVVTMGGAYLSLKITPVILFSGWIAAAPYNYYRLKKYNVSCH